MHKMSKDRERNSNNGSPSKLSVTKSNAKSWGDSGKVHSSASSDNMLKRKGSYQDQRNSSAGEGYVYQTRMKGGRASPMAVVESRPPQK